MIRQVLALAVAALLLPAPARCLTQEQMTRKATQIPVGSVVDVKSKAGKVRGQLLAVEAAGVVIRTAAKQGPVIEQAVSFAEMKDIRLVDTNNRATKGLAVFGGVVLVWMIAGSIIMAAAGGS